jgi:hypothetical protein
MTNPNFCNQDDIDAYYQNQQQSSSVQSINQTGGDKDNYPECVFPRFHSLKVHGNKAAFEIKPSKSRSGFHTVNIEGALAIPNSAVNGKGTKFDWQNNKIVLQITKTELPELIMVLLGLKIDLSFANHNIGSVAKSFTLANQGSNHFACVKLYDNQNNNKNRICPVPISPYEAMMAGQMALVQYCQNFPTLTTDSALKCFHLQATAAQRFKK